MDLLEQAWTASSLELPEKSCPGCFLPTSALILLQLTVNALC